VYNWAAPGLMLVLPRAAAVTRGARQHKHATIHYTGAGRRGVGEEERRGNKGKGEGTNRLARPSTAGCEATGAMIRTRGGRGGAASCVRWWNGTWNVLGRTESWKCLVLCAVE
jgi:hypothetical protein